MKGCPRLFPYLSEWFNWNAGHFVLLDLARPAGMSAVLMAALTCLSASLIPPVTEQSADATPLAYMIRRNLLEAAKCNGLTKSKDACRSQSSLTGILEM